MNRVAAAAVAAIAFAATPAIAAETLDQSCVPATPTYAAPTGITLWGANSVGLAQTFTAGTAGTLSRIAIGITNSGPAQSATLRLFGSGPSQFGSLGTALYTAAITLPTFNLPFGVNFDWSTMPSWDVTAADIQLTPGQQLMFAITLPANNSAIAFINTVGTTWTSTSDPYAGGQLYLGQLADYGYGRLQPSSDVAFQTFVAGGAVPEPASWAMLVVGFGLVGGALRVRRRSVSFGRSGLAVLKA